MIVLVGRVRQNSVAELRGRTKRHGVALRWNDPKANAAAYMFAGEPTEELTKEE